METGVRSNNVEGGQEKEGSFLPQIAPTGISAPRDGDRRTAITKDDLMTLTKSEFRSERQISSRACSSPISSIVGSTLNQMNLKRSSSAPMINQLGTTPTDSESPVVTDTAGVVKSSPGNVTLRKDSIDAEIGDASSFANSFLASLSGTRPRRFSASFSPASPGPAPNRVSQLRHENTADWETASEKEFHGTVNIAQSWEDLSLESMSMEVPMRRPSISDQLWLTMPVFSGNSASASASSSPAASPRVISRFSPALGSPSPTRKSFTTRRSLSPIAVRPSVLGVKRKCDWDAMDCSPQPAKRIGGLLTFQPSPSSHMNHMMHEDSPNSFETESSVSSGGRDSPFFRIMDSPVNSPGTSPHPNINFLNQK